MRRCWGRNRNFRRCGRRGNWKCFCDDHRLQPIAAVVFLVFTIVAGVASIQSAWFPEFWSKRKPTSYRASFGSTLLSQSREEAGGIWICADHGSGQAMTPVNFATFLTIENLHEHPTQVTSLTVDIRGDRGPWVRLLRLDPLPTFSEILCCAPRSSGLNFLGTVGLESGGLIGQLWHGVLHPHVPITDIAFFEYPLGYSGPGPRFEMRLNLRDSDGSTFSVAEARPISHPAEDYSAVQADRLTVPAPYKDYSSLPVLLFKP